MDLARTLSGAVLFCDRRAGLNCCYAPSLFPRCLGDAEAAVNFARQLLALGADPNLRSRWTNMRALHYAAYFDVPQLIQVVLQASQPGGEKMSSVRVVCLRRRRRRLICGQIPLWVCFIISGLDFIALKMYVAFLQFSVDKSISCFQDQS